MRDWERDRERERQREKYDMWIMKQKCCRSELRKIDIMGHWDKKERDIMPKRKNIDRQRQEKSDEAIKTERVIKRKRKIEIDKFKEKETERQTER